MTSHIAWVVAVLLLAPATGRAAGLDSSCDRDQATQQRGSHPQQGAGPGKPGEPRPPMKLWWIDAQLRSDLGVTDQQSAAVDKVWKKSMPSLMEGRKKLDTLEETLSVLTASTDETAVIAQIAKVEDLRAELAKVRTLMIYRMNLLLKPDQRAKVKAMYERREGRRGPSSDK